MSFELKRNSTEVKSSTLFSVCDHCGSYGKYRNAKGVDYNWQDDALMCMKFSIRLIGVLILLIVQKRRRERITCIT